jgi:hypothetical protein
MTQKQSESTSKAERLLAVAADLADLKAKMIIRPDGVLYRRLTADQREIEAVALLVGLDET